MNTLIGPLTTNTPGRFRKTRPIGTFQVNTAAGNRAVPATPFSYIYLFRGSVWPILSGGLTIQGTWLGVAVIDPRYQGSG